MPRQKQQFEAMRSATQEKIMAAGLKLFAQRGLAATSIQEIAALAGISTGLMYHYYPSKEDLFNELVATAVNSASEATDRLFNSDLSPAEKVRTFSKEVLADIAQGDWISQLYLLMIHYLLAAQPSEQTAEIQRKGFAPLDTVKRTLLAGQALGEIKPGDPGELALLYFSAIQGLALYKLTMGERFAAPSPALLNALLLTAPEAGD